MKLPFGRSKIVDYWGCPNFDSYDPLGQGFVHILQKVPRIIAWCPEQDINWRASRTKPLASESSWRQCGGTHGLGPSYSWPGRGYLYVCLPLSPACPLQRKYSCNVLWQQWGEIDKRLFHQLFLCPDGPLGTREQETTVFWRLQEEVTVIS